LKGLDARVPGIKAVGVRPDDLVQRKMSFAVVPECEAAVVGVVAGVDLDVVALHADEKVHFAGIGGLAFKGLISRLGVGRTMT